MKQAMSSIKKVSIQGYDSLGRVTIEMGKLTILAGRNNTGKSSAMHPLLLLRQSLNHTNDTRDILVTWGPHVVFASAEKALMGEDKEFVTRIETDTSTGEWVFRLKEGALSVIKCKWGYDVMIDLHPNMSSQEIVAAARVLFPNAPAMHMNWTDFDLVAHRASLILAPRYTDIWNIDFFDYFDPPPPWVPIYKTIQSLIHIPSVRANPELSYVFTVPVGPMMPGVFVNYLAGILYYWKEERGRLEEVENDLNFLGLAQKINVRQTSAISAEIFVLLPGAQEYTNVANAGAGLLSVLPAVVALRVAQPGQIVYIEHPEEGLHPSTQVGFAHLLVEAVKRGVQVVIETHSELVLLGIQFAMAQRTLIPGEVILNWFEKDKTGVKIGTDALDKDGMFSCSVDFNSVSLRAMKNYLDEVSQQRESNRQLSG